MRRITADSVTMLSFNFYKLISSLWRFSDWIKEKWDGASRAQRWRDKNEDRGAEETMLMPEIPRVGCGSGASQKLRFVLFLQQTP